MGHKMLNVCMFLDGRFIQINAEKAENNNLVLLILYSALFLNLKPMNSKLEVRRLRFHLETICKKICETVFTTGG